MAYVSQEFKKEVAPVVKEILARHGLKGSLSVRHNMTLVLKIREGALDFIGNYLEGSDRAGVTYLDINPYWFESHFSGPCRDCLRELIAAMKTDKYFNDSDPQTDYFHCSHYIDIAVGTWDKPYKFTGGEK